MGLLRVGLGGLTCRDTAEALRSIPAAASDDPLGSGRLYRWSKQGPERPRVSDLGQGAGQGGQLTAT